jgi:peptidoglycan/LPS O-acetylase OafA/YrhL
VTADAAGPGDVVTDVAPAVLVPPPGNPRFPLIDGVRAIAALSIVLFHSARLTGFADVLRGELAAGVPCFFVISGFLLYRPFVAGRLSERSRIRSRDFARRRLLRIVPAYWVALTVLAIYPGLSGDVFSRRAVLYYGFAQTFSPHTIFGGLFVAWSLSTEMTFYLALPLYALSLDRLCRRGPPERVLRLELALLAALSIGAMTFRALVFGGRHWNLAFTILGTFDWFAAGMALAVLSAVSMYRESIPLLERLVGRRATLCWAAALATYLAAAVYANTVGRRDAPYSAGLVHYLWLVIALCLVLPAIFGGESTGLPRRVLSTRFVAWLGLVSYGIFLWHAPILGKLGMRLNGWHHLSPNSRLGLVLVLAIGGGISIALAAASYYLVELPFLIRKERRPPRRGAGPTAASL